MIRNVGMIGTGNMGSAILRGIVEASYVKPTQLTVFDVSRRKLKEIEEDIPGIQVARDCLEVAEAADLIILAVKPLYVREVSDEIRPGLQGTAVLSCSRPSLRRISIMPRESSMLWERPGSCRNGCLTESSQFPVQVRPTYI